MRKKLILDTKCKRGITLVSLVVTIIVLLILAGITINLIIGEDGIIRRAQDAGKNYIDAAENEKVQLGQFTNEMDNIIGGSTNSGRTPYNSEFRKNVVEAIKNAGVATTENDTDETIITNIGKILKEATKDATATADNISEGKTAWVNGELITGNGADNEAYYSQGWSDNIANGQFTIVRYDTVSNGGFDSYECYFEEDGIIAIYQISLQDWWDNLPTLSGHKNFIKYDASQSSKICCIIAEVEKGKTLSVSYSQPGGSTHSGLRIVLQITGVRINT